MPSLIPYPHCLTHRMSICRPLSPSTSVPPEIWLQIFRTATHIPGEGDVSATTPHPGMFTSWDLLQWKAHRVVLPLRRTIVQVSRLWWEVGSEVLYASFHETELYHHPPMSALDYFERSLLSRPAFGRFVKRLALRWPRKRDSSQIDHVLQLCPNTLILSFYYADASYRCPWEPSILFDHVRILDASVYGLSQKVLVQMLSSLLGLEILHLSGLERGLEESRCDGTLRLPSVRLLSLSFKDQQGIEYWTPLFSTTDLPRLTSFSMNPGRAPLPFPIDIWRRITSFRYFIGIHDALTPEFFRSLAPLHWGIGAQSLEGQQGHSPFHRLHHLTISSCGIPYNSVRKWKQIAEGYLALPLNRSEMPLLRVLELEWGPYGIHGNFILMSEHRQYMSFLHYLESATLEFERLGVQFQEVYERNIYCMSTPMSDVIKNARDKMRI